MKKQVECPITKFYRAWRHNYNINMMLDRVRLMEEPMSFSDIGAFGMSRKVRACMPHMLENREDSNA
jgi:hypothetical protein